MADDILIRCMFVDSVKEISMIFFGSQKGGKLICHCSFLFGKAR